MEFIFQGTTVFFKDPVLMATTWWKRDWSDDLRPEVLREDLRYLVNDPKSVFGIVIQAQNLLPPSPSGDRGQPQTLRSNVMLEETRVATLVPSLRLLASAFLGAGVREVPMELTLDEDGLIETVVLTRSEPENQPPTTYSFRFFDYGAPVQMPSPQGPIRDRSELEAGYETKSGREQLYPSETPDPQPT